MVGMGPCHVLHVIISSWLGIYLRATLSRHRSRHGREGRVVGHSTMRMLSTLYSSTYIHSMHHRLQKLEQDISLASLSIPSRRPCRNTSFVFDPTSTLRSFKPFLNFSTVVSSGPAVQGRLRSKLTSYQVIWTIKTPKYLGRHPSHSQGEVFQGLKLDKHGSPLMLRRQQARGRSSTP